MRPKPKSPRTERPVPARAADKADELRVIPANVSLDPGTPWPRLRRDGSAPGTRRSKRGRDNGPAPDSDNESTASADYFPEETVSRPVRYRILFRALRDDDDPAKGLKGANPRATSRTVAQHVGGGGKSPYVSTTQSPRKATKWALSSGKKNAPRIAMLRVPETVPIADISDQATAERLKLGKTAHNFARSSSEVVLRGPVPRDQIHRVFKLKIVRARAPGMRHVRARILTSAAEHRNSRNLQRARQLIAMEEVAF